LNRGGAHAHRLGDLPHGHPIGTKLLEPVYINTGTRTAQACPTSSSGGNPGLRPLDEPCPLLLGHPGEDGDEQRPHGGARVEPGLPHRDDLNAQAVKFENILQVADHAPTEAVEGPYDQDLELPAPGRP